VGFNQHKEVLPFAEGLSLWGAFEDLAPGVQDGFTKARRQLGSLGGGNHFIELCLDQDQGVWLMLHSGSRNIGNLLAQIHIGVARKLTHNADLPDRDLAVFLAGTPEMAAYRHDLFWAQSYAFANREAMLTLLKAVLVDHFPEVAFEAPILCHHNYVSEEVHFGEELLVTRKGAIRAGRGEWGIIPGSMGTRSYIVRGLGNEDSLLSASHGAGRTMSRSAAKRKFTLEDVASQTDGVECRKDAGIIDEIPGAYKDIDQVMENQKDLVETGHVLKALLCVKG
jgi:tRNA-splicing ligase RtcB